MKNKKLKFGVGIGIILAIVAWEAVSAFQQSKTYYITVSELTSEHAAPSSVLATGTSQGDIQTTPNSSTRLGVPLLVCLLLVLLWALGVRLSKEWPRRKDRQPASPAQKEIEAKLETLLNSLADLEEVLASRNIAQKTYWKEKLELKARLAAILKKSPPAVLESYATRNLPH
jgi:hypothetical protein